VHVLTSSCEKPRPTIRAKYDATIDSTRGGDIQLKSTARPKYDATINDDKKNNRGSN
jgi:hypothetical protein